MIVNNKQLLQQILTLNNEIAALKLINDKLTDEIEIRDAKLDKRDKQIPELISKIKHQKIDLEILQEVIETLQGMIHKKTHNP